MEQPPVRILQGFLDMLMENGLSLPPLPSMAGRFLQPVDEYIFSTHPEWEPVVGRYVTFSPSVSDTEDEPEHSEAGDIRFYCGLGGYGVQNWTFRYVLATPCLELGCVLPYGSAYGDTAADLRRIEEVCGLIRGCLAVTRCGEVFGERREGRLQMIMDGEGFRFTLSDTQGNVVREGTRLATFLDILAVWGENTDGGGTREWTRV